VPGHALTITDVSIAIEDAKSDMERFLNDLLSPVEKNLPFL
jgi:hypothetical protein